MSGKGSGRRPGTGYGEGFDRIFNRRRTDPKPEPVATEPVLPEVKEAVEQIFDELRKEQEK